MKKLIRMAFREVRGVREIHLPEESSPLFSHAVETLGDMLLEHHADHFLVEGKNGSFYIKFSSNRWIGVTTDSDVSEVLIRAALDRTVKFLKKHQEAKQRLEGLQQDMEEFFLANGITARVRTVNLSMETDSLSGKIRLSARKGRTRAIKELVHTFLENQLPYFIKNNVTITIEKQSLLDRITRDQLVRIIRRVERL
jgi:predicted DNA-binding protein